MLRAASHDGIGHTGNSNFDAHAVTIVWQRYAQRPRDYWFSNLLECVE